MSLLHHDVRREAFAVASHFRDDFFDCLPVRGDTLIALTDALLCADGPVTTPVDLTLTAEHRRGHGAMYEAGQPDRGMENVTRMSHQMIYLGHPGDALGLLGVAATKASLPATRALVSSQWVHAALGQGHDAERHLARPTNC